MKRIKTLITTALLLLGVTGVTALTAVPTFAAINPQEQICAGTGGTGGAGGCAGNSTQGSLTNIFKNVVNVLLFLVGIVAVIVIIVSGFKYVTSNGDASKVKSAKDTLLYAIIGVIVAILAFAIVNFVIANIK